MLRAFTLQNFQSFKEPTRISLELNRHTPEDDRSCLSATGARLAKATAIIGANASGKTTLLKSLAFLAWFVKNSFHAKPDTLIPVEAHFSTPDEPSTFEVEFDMDGIEWRYLLSVSPERVHHEALYARHSRAFSYVFIRNWDAQKQAYQVKQQQFGLLQKEAEKVRPNASLLATAAQYQVDIALQFAELPIFNNVDALGRLPMDRSQILNISQFYADHAEMRQQMAALLHKWDFGLSDVELKKHEVTREDGTSEEIYLPFGVHNIDGKEHRLMFLHESSGTQGAFLLLARILPALQHGGLAVIDELESDLHPHMMVPILDLFFSPKQNPHHAQIIFTSHSLEVLSLLHKAQVILVEKDQACASTAWRLDSVKGVRADDNLYAKYMAGAYGAVPQL
ncbi:AAA family ATPase [Alcaligenaceae bacterium SJ-26]|nr:AAA family ATPase [Alcaligenaceae bacterium SJ-26]